MGCAPLPPVESPVPEPFPNPEPFPIPKDDREPNPRRKKSVSFGTVSKALDCHLDRYNIIDLTQILFDLISGRLPDVRREEIKDILEKDINFSRDAGRNAPKDKISPEQRKVFDPDTSISSAEAYTFVKKLIVNSGMNDASVESFVGRSFVDIFFGGSLYKLPPPREVEITSIHDADTATVVDKQSEECNAGVESTLSVRVGGPDAPEISNFYDEAEADKIRGKGSIYRPTPKSAFTHPTHISYYDGNGQKWLNSKLVENVDKVHQELSRGKWSPKKLAFNDRAALNTIIAATIDWTGDLSTLILKDFLSWRVTRPEAGALYMIGSQIHWKSDDTPESLCMTWQPFDVYARGLDSFVVEERRSIVQYVRERLPKLMEKEGMTLLGEYQERAKSILDSLSSSRNTAIREAATALANSAPKPSDIYSAEKTSQMADVLEDVINNSDIDYAWGDIQAMQMVTGSVYAYMKYRNQRGPLYEAAGLAAQGHNFGLWNETTFKKLWEFNYKIERYNPPVCAKK